MNSTCKCKRAHTHTHTRTHERHMARLATRECRRKRRCWEEGKELSEKDRWVMEGGTGGGELVKVRRDENTKQSGDRQIPRVREEANRQTERENARYRRRAIPDCCSEPFLWAQRQNKPLWCLWCSALAEKNQRRYTTTSAAETRTGRNKQGRGERGWNKTMRRGAEEGGKIGKFHSPAINSHTSLLK